MRVSQYKLLALLAVFAAPLLIVGRSPAQKPRQAPRNGVGRGRA